MTGQMYQLSLAYRNLKSIHSDIVKEFSPYIKELDLSNNSISDITVLRDFQKLESLVLDNNDLTSHSKLPKLPKLRTFWVNRNKIANLALFVDKLVDALPQLQYLSMLNNEACPNFFNGGSLSQYKDCRYYVLSRMRNLVQFNDQIVTEEELKEA